MRALPLAHARRAYAGTLFATADSGVAEDGSPTGGAGDGVISRRELASRLLAVARDHHKALVRGGGSTYFLFIPTT